MKKEILLLVIFMFYWATASTAQCTFSAGADKTIVCGESVQLNIEPKFMLKNTSIYTSLKSVFFINSEKGYTVGNNGQIFKTIDGGNNWSTQSSGTTSNLNSVYFTDALTGYVVGGEEGFSMSAGTTILKTTNGGTNWISQSHNLNYYGLTSVFFTNTNNGFVLGGLDIRSTTNGGNNWNSLTSSVFSEGMMNKVFFSDENTGYVIGFQGKISKTVNKGSNWIAQSSGVSVTLNSLHFINNTGYIVGNNGTILKTTNGGTNWVKQVSNTTNNLNSVFFINTETGYIVGANGTILRTKNGGGNWEQLQSGTTSNLNSVFLSNSTHGFIVGDNGTCLKLTSPNSYSWAPSIGLDKNDIPNPVVNILETTTYIVTTNTDGCISKDTINIIVSPLTANAGTDKTIICGGTVQLNSLTTNYTGTGTLKYKWTPATGLNNDSIANPTATITNDITYTVTVTSPNGCTATDDIKVTVNPLTANAGTDKTIICGGTIQLNSVTTNYTGIGTLKYKWTPATGLNNDSIANPTATVTYDITYIVTVTTPNGCTATDGVSVIIIPMAKPEIGLVGLSTNNKNLIAWNKPTSVGIESYNIYRETNITNVYEKIGNVPYDSLSIYVDNQSLPAVQSNKYKLSILDRHGLESPHSNSHKTMHLAINKGIGNVWNLIWETYEGFLVTTYNIYRGTTPTNLTLLGSTSGNNNQYNDLNAPSGEIYYQLEVISPNIVNPTKILNSQKTKTEEDGLLNSINSYSSSRSNIATNVISSINEIVENEKIIIYPNPAKNEFRIDFEGGSTFEILNLMGQVVYKGNLIESAIVQTSNMFPSMYLIRFKIGNRFEYKKIIKE